MIPKYFDFSDVLTLASRTLFSSGNNIETEIFSINAANVMVMNAKVIAMKVISTVKCFNVKQEYLQKGQKKGQL